MEPHDHSHAPLRQPLGCRCGGERHRIGKNNNFFFKKKFISNLFLQAVIFDSSKKLAERPKATTEQIKAAVKKILEAIQATNNHDTTTGRFKVRFTWNKYREAQKDGDSCGLYSIVHARRVLERGNSNAKRDNDPKVNPRAERRALRATIVELMEFFENLERRKEKLLHGAAGFLEFSPKKTLNGTTSRKIDEQYQNSSN